MVIRTDRTTKLLLLIVAALLAALVVRPLWPTSQAIAAEATPTPRPGPTGFRLTEVGVINIPDNLTVREMQVVDSAQAVVVRLNDRISVYRVDRYFLPLNTPIK